MEARNRSLPDWFTRIRTRQIMLPRFQRFEAWSRRDVASLLDTVLKGLPAGALLVLEVGDEAPFVARPMEGAPDEGERVTEHLLDGQQRLTALWKALHGLYEDRSYFVSVRPDDETSEVNQVSSRARWYKNGERYPLWLDDPAKLWEAGLVPVEVLRPDAESEAKEWAKAAAPRDDDGVPDTDAILEVVETANGLRQLFDRFNLPFLSLPVTVPKETALDVFITMNTSATPLSAFDVVVAQVEAETGESLHDLAGALRAEASDLDAYGDADDVLLRSAALLQGKTWQRSSLFTADYPGRLVEDFPTVVAGARRAVRFLEDERVFDRKRLPTEVVLPMLVALWGRAP